MNNDNREIVSIADVVAVVKGQSVPATIPDEINVDSVTSTNSTVRMDFTETGDDKGVAITGGQLEVGTKTEPQESVFGGGDSYPCELAYHYNTSNETGLTITGATDITTILQSDTGSSVGLFENNLIGDVILIGADQPYLGVKIKYESLGDVSPDRIASEYLNNASNWMEDTYMITESNYPYRKASWYLASYTSEQMRFGDSVLESTSNWGLQTLNINGVTMTKYWTRLRLITPLNTVPQVEQVKQHSNRTEINSDGVVEFFGLARGVKEIFSDSYANNLSDPSNENVTYFTGGIDGGASKLVDNEFANNTRDSRILIVKIDEDVDTSTPVLISYPFYVKGIQTGDIRFDFEYVQITEDFIYDNQVEPDGSETVIYPIITPSNLERQVVQVEIPIDKIAPTTGGVAVVITRDANAVEDTVNASVILTGSNVKARRWRL